MLTQKIISKRSLVIPIDILFFAVMAATTLVSAQNQQKDRTKSYLDLSWKNVTENMPDEWHGSEEAKTAADSILKYQTEIGGWPKNSSFHSGVDREEWSRIKSSGTGATFDNGATIREMKFLARVHGKIKDERYREAFIKGFEYILKAQYHNGGWPQYYPYRKGGGAYSSHVTYNDNAMVNVMLLLKEIANTDTFHQSIEIDDKMRARAKSAFDNGVKCILNTQIIVKGQPTVWCAQHDEFTLEPAKARSYELPSFSGSESVGITLLLMDIEKPSDEVIDAVKGAVKWFEKNKIEGIKVVPIKAPEGKDDKKVVEDKSASALWARFYDLETGKPFFCDRDGIKKNSLAEIGYNRRSGYSWYTDKPEIVLERYPEWAKKHGMNSN